MRVDPKNGKKSKTLFEVLEKFSGCTLLRCEPLTGRTAPDSRSPASRRFADRRRRTLRRQTALAFAAETGLPAQARTRRTAADFPGRAARGGIDPAASRHRRNPDHHRAVAEGFESGGEISAAVCHVAKPAKRGRFFCKQPAFSQTRRLPKAVARFRPAKVFCPRKRASKGWVIKHEFIGPCRQMIEAARMRILLWSKSYSAKGDIGTVRLNQGCHRGG